MLAPTGGRPATGRTNGAIEVPTDADDYRHPWLGVEMRHLAALAAIARHRSFSAAADELGYVQSAISQQIARLERVVGACLVVRQRGQRTVTLTPAGEALAAHARLLLRELQAARLDLVATQEGGAEIMRAGMAPGIANWLMPRLMIRLASEKLVRRARFSEPGDASQVEELVERGDLDVGFGPPPPDDDAFAWRELVRDEYVVVTSAESMLGRRGAPIAAAELADYTVMAPPACSADFAAVELQLNASGLDLHNAVRSPLTPAYAAFVSAGLGVALMPALAVDPRASSLRVLELADVQVSRVVCLFWQRHRHATGPLEDFARLAQASVAELDREPEVELASEGEPARAVA